MGFFKRLFSRRGTSPEAPAERTETKKDKTSIIKKNTEAEKNLRKGYRDSSGEHLAVRKTMRDNRGALPYNPNRIDEAPQPVKQELSKKWAERSGVTQDDVEKRIGYKDKKKDYTETVQNFQRERGLAPDGIAGPKTLNELYKRERPAPAPQPAPQAERPAPAPQPAPQAERPAPAPQPAPQAERPAPAPQPAPQAERPAPAPQPAPQAERPAPAPQPAPQAERPAPAPQPAPQAERPAPAPQPAPQAERPAPAPQPAPQAERPAPAPQPAPQAERPAPAPQPAPQAERPAPAPQPAPTKEAKKIKVPTGGTEVAKELGKLPGPDGRDSDGNTVVDKNRKEPKKEEPKKEEPKKEEPKKEEPKKEEPKKEEPKKEEPKKEEPKKEEPKKEEPKKEEPKKEEPKKEEPKKEEPKKEEPKKEEPKKEEPKKEEPKKEEPKREPEKPAPAPQPGKILYWKSKNGSGVSGIITKVEGDTVHYDFKGPLGVNHFTVKKSKMAAYDYIVGEPDTMSDEEKKNYGFQTSDKKSDTSEAITYKKIPGGYEYKYGAAEYRINPGSTIGNLKVKRIIDTGNPAKANVILAPMNTDGSIDESREFMRPIDELMRSWRAEN